MKRHRLLRVFILFGLTNAVVAAQAADHHWQEPVDVAFTACCDDSTQRYVVMLPQQFDRSKPADLVVALHGHGSDRWQFVRDKRDECRALRDAAACRGMIFVAPDYRAKTSWMGPKAEADVLQILDEVEGKYRIRHTLLCGGSMGASAALTFAALHPDRVDGVVALNGTANHVEYKGFQKAIAQSFGGTKTEVPDEYKRRSAELQADRLTMPIAATVGGRDTSVPPDSVRRLIHKLRKRGRAILLIDRPQQGHATNYDDTMAAMRFVIEQVQRNGGRRAIVLPDSCNTPDAMALLGDGSLILSVPNFTAPTSPGVLMKISPRDKVSLFCRLPLHPETKRVYPMGVREAPDGSLYVADCQCMDATPNNSRLLCVRIVDGKPDRVDVVARGLNVANGVAIRDGFVYVTDSSTGTTDAGATTSAVYRFRFDERDVQIQAGGDDPHLVVTQTTVCQEIPVGADGIDFDHHGNLYVANCGDGLIERFELDNSGKVASRKVITPTGAMKSADGIFFDRRTKRIFVADILANAIRSVTLDGRVETIAEDADNDGSAGQLDGPSEVIARGNELIAANFDRVFPGSVNTNPDKPYSLTVVRLERTTEKPNFLFILIDDLGWHDVGCNGNTIYDTPNVDRLAASGMRFTNGYAACNCCSPTRASILTGKYPARLHVTDWIPGSSWAWTKLRSPDWTKHLPLEEVTIAEALKSAGYVCAHVGKWHLGGNIYLPEKQGFDFNFGGCEKGCPRSYFPPYGIPASKKSSQDEYLTDRVTNEAIAFIREKRDCPFFVYLSYYTVHQPLQAKAELVKKYRQRGRPNRGATNATFAAMVEHMDQGVGRVLDTLDELGLTENTVVFFMSDNGGLVRKLQGGIRPGHVMHCIASTSNAPLRGGKGSPYEGGVREPWLIRWPVAIKPGTTSNVPVISVDFFPTILDIAGVEIDPAWKVDGKSLLPLFTQSGKLEREAIYWHYPHYNVCGQAQVRPYGAVRSGPWKLIEHYEDGQVELYDLEADLSEKNNLAHSHAAKATKLQSMLHAWREQVDAQMPLANPKYNAKKAEQIYQWWGSLPTN